MYAAPRSCTSRQDWAGGGLVAPRWPQGDWSGQLQGRRAGNFTGLNFRTSELPNCFKDVPAPLSPPMHDDHGTPGASARFNSWTLTCAAKWAKPRLHLDHKATRSLNIPQPSLALHEHGHTLSPTLTDIHAGHQSRVVLKQVFTHSTAVGLGSTQSLGYRLIT